MAVLAPGQTNGPTDMSVLATLLVTELGLLAARLPAADFVSSLRQRLLDAESNCESQGAPTVQMLLSPLEQGVLMGALGACTCQFSMGLRGRLQALVQQKLAALGAQLG